MNKSAIVTILLIITAASQSCRTTKQINQVIAPKDSVTVVVNNTSVADSLKMVNETIQRLKSHYINYKTFNAKIKVEYEDNKGKQPDISAVVRIYRDSAIWISLSATILNFEVYRLLITKDSVVLMNMREKEVQYRSVDYLQEVTQIPFDYTTIQDLLVGNPVFLDSTIASYKKMEDKILVSTIGAYFKNLLTLSTDKNLLLHSKLDDVDITRNRTADITYSEYENKTGFNFSTNREITISEKNKVDIRFNYKQYEFNKELSVVFKVPKNYKRR
jgi:outer membrane lipoprotein-sorting protein